MEGRLGGQHHDEDRGRTDRDRTDRERKDRDRADRDRADRDRADRDRRDMERRDMGHWHQSDSFGDNSRRSSSFDGQWHVESDSR
jgi:transcription termination factor Rho